MWRTDGCLRCGARTSSGFAVLGLLDLRPHPLQRQDPDRLTVAGCGPRSCDGGFALLWQLAQEMNEPQHGGEYQHPHARRSGYVWRTSVTMDTAATAPELAKEFLVAHSAGWKRRSNCPCASAGRSTSSSWSFPDEAGVPAGPSPGAPCGVPPVHPHLSPAVRFLPSPSARLSAGQFPDAPRNSAPVIAHQAIGMHPPLGFAASLASVNRTFWRTFLTTELSVFVIVSQWNQRKLINTYLQPAPGML